MKYSNTPDICAFACPLFTGWTNVSLLYLPDSIEIATLKGFTLWVPRNQPIKIAVDIVVYDFHGLKTMTFHCVADIAYF